MSDLLIYTAQFGGYDALTSQLPQDIDARWVCYTDQDGPLPAPWEKRHVDLGGAHPNLAAKLLKTDPPAGDWRYAIWIDANMEVIAPYFARQAILSIHDGMAIWAHPRRVTVAAEIEASAPGGKESQGDRYVNLDLRGQLAAWRAEGFPDDRGLYASGTIVWTPEAAATIGKAWRAEVERWGCFHDQVCLPVVTWRLGVRPGLFPIDQIERRWSTRANPRHRINGEPFYLGNRWLRIWPHAQDPEK